MTSCAKNMRTYKNIVDKMPSESTSLACNSQAQQTEKSHHYSYLKEFRTQQCPLFLQHKCTQHRPFTCFHWHFMNQRRRRPIRRRDGTFNYSPDIYCTKFDETTGLCPDKDDCPYLHRTAGDTERRYHLRYYKTGTCVHETDTKGNCVKNGPHCAFAHGADDLRAPIYDVRELQAMELNLDKSPVTSAPGSLEKDKTLTDDPTWNDTNYVLSHYKTEACKRPPRLCRQGYACPQYHNNRDRRRSPKLHKYRSPPCPNVKHGDDWGDPSQCEKEDSCGYCHTRTEQQFHPEIYKSTKCNDMVQTGYCPRGPFCAFAHVEQEMMIHRDVNITSDNPLSAFIASVSPITSTPPAASTLPSLSAPAITKVNGTSIADLIHSGTRFSESKENINPDINQMPQPIGKERANSFSKNYANVVSSANVVFNNHGSIGKERSPSQSSIPSVADFTNQIMFFHPPPSLHRDETQHKLQQQLQCIDSDVSLDTDEKFKRKQNLILLHNLNAQSRIAPPTFPMPGIPSSMSPLAPSFYPPADTVESVIGNALEDLTFDDFDITSIDRELDRDDTNSVSSSVSVGLPSSGCFGGSSVPVSIPHNNVTRSSLGSLSQSPSSPLNVLTAPLHVQQQKQEHQIEQAAAAFHSHPNPGKYPAPAFSDISLSSMSPRSVSGGQQSPMYSPSLCSTPANHSAAAAGNTNHNNSHAADLQRLHDEISLYKSKLSSWEDGYSQAKSACEAWRKEAEESNRKATTSDEDRKQAIRQRDEAVGQLKKMKQDQDLLGLGAYVRCLQPTKELDVLPTTQILQLQQVLRLDMERLEKVVQRSAAKCVRCHERPKSVMLAPCNHYMLCDTCALVVTECPVCHVTITKKTSLILTV